MQSATRAILVTVGCLIVYEAGYLIQFPLLTAESVEQAIRPYYFETGHVNLFALGLMPAISGFFYVEIFSFIIPKLKRHRAGGVNGRRRLNYYSIALAIMLALLRASFVASSFSISIVIDNGIPIGPEPSSTTVILLILFLLIGFGILLWLGNCISRYGIGNGFCVIVVYGIIKDKFFLLYRYFDYSGKVSAEIYLEHILLVVYVIAILSIYMGKPNKIKATFSGNKINFEIPKFPQGLMPISWPDAIFWIPFFFILPVDFHFYAYDLSGVALYVGILLPVSVLTYLMICGPSRIRNNTDGKLQFQEGWNSKLKVATVKGVFLIVALYLLLRIPPLATITEGSLDYGTEGLGSLIILVAICRDILIQYKFMKSVKTYKVLCDFDNVHYVTMLKGLFEKENIKFCIQGFEYRRLYFFFSPLYKMKLLVDDTDYERARELADLDNIKTI